MYTQEQIKEKLATNQQWLERAVLAIYARQTAAEQTVEETVDLNNQGFNAFDAKYLTYIAKWLQSGKHLDGRHLEKTRTRMQKYCRQLTEIANAKETATVAAPVPTEELLSPETIEKLTAKKIAVEASELGQEVESPLTFQGREYNIFSEDYDVEGDIISWTFMTADGVYTLVIFND
jgi:hypothetical protein